jgi:putative serine protease PepD
MSGPKHLWSGDWRKRPEDEPAPERPEVPALPALPPLGAEPPTAVAAPAAHHGEPDGPNVALRLVVAALVVAVLVAGGLAARAAFTGGEDAATQLGRSDAKPLPALGGGAGGGDEAVRRVYAAAGPAVVSIRSSDGEGTGFLIDRSGTVVTNSHVIGSDDDVQVRFGPDGKTLQADVLGDDPSSDLAVVRIEGSVPDVRPLGFADSSKLRVGDTAIAIGNPFGLERTATVGIVSALGREITAPNGFSIDEVVQTDAPINPGNSGGPLLDTRGRVIGVNSQIATNGAGSGNLGIGFAVPSNTAREIVPQLAQGRQIERPWLGVSTGPSPRGDAAIIGEVTPGGPAERAGLRAGDEIVQVDDQRVGDPEDVSKGVSARTPGDRIEVRVRRGGAQETIEVTLGIRPQGGP